MSLVIRVSTSETLTTELDLNHSPLTHTTNSIEWGRRRRVNKGKYGKEEGACHTPILTLNR